jgi:hypothetical protein
MRFSIRYHKGEGYNIFRGGRHVVGPFRTKAEAQTYLKKMKDDVRRSNPGTRKRRTNAAKKRRKPAKRPNPSSPSVKTGKFIPCRGVVLDKRGVVKKMLVEDKNMGKVLSRRKK